MRLTRGIKGIYQNRFIKAYIHVAHMNNLNSSIEYYINHGKIGLIRKNKSQL